MTEPTNHPAQGNNPDAPPVADTFAGPVGGPRPTAAGFPLPVPEAPSTTPEESGM